ncbi:MAG: alpha/beta fold hydrolase [Anaerolineales bacterium]|nr:alpha/beta fold hydrolase [Anaerolineales bacterium]MDW8276567.1 alpha/beta fold hydrolase [Anaerolineales bacterium]
MMLRPWRFLWLFCVVLYSACQPAPVAPEAPPLPTPVVLTQTLPPSPTATVLPPSRTPSITPSPTAIPHPMSIAALRAGTYPGSEIVIERELERGANYRRYYVYYLSEGLKIYALLTLPDGQMPSGGWPGLVFNHGYIPPQVYRTTERYIAYVDRLARAGYVVFRIDYRGHDRSEGEATGAYGHPGYLIDVLNAVSALQQHPQVNPEKIGMWGHSMGGYLTLRAMVVSQQVKAGVIWAGVVASYPEMLYNWRRTGAFTPSPSSRGAGWRGTWLETYGTPEQNPEFWASISANTYLSDLSGPLQLHHGTADEDVPVAFSIRLAEQARTAGQTVELYLYEGDNHNISRFFTTAMNRTIAFFDRVLK